MACVQVNIPGDKYWLKILQIAAGPAVKCTQRGARFPWVVPDVSRSKRRGSWCAQTRSAVPPAWLCKLVLGSCEPFTPLLHHVTTALLIYSPSSAKTADTDTAEGAAGKERKKKIPCSPMSQVQKCSHSGSESCLGRRYTPSSHRNHCCPSHWKICPSSDTDFKCIAITISISGETEYFTLPVCSIQRWFLMNGMIFA